MKVYLVNQFDRWCPENDSGADIVAIFSTREFAQAYVDKHDPKDAKGKRRSPDGLSIREREVDEEIINGITTPLSSYTYEDLYTIEEDNDTGKANPYPVVYDYEDSLTLAKDEEE